MGKITSARLSQRLISITKKLTVEHASLYGLGFKVKLFGIVLADCGRMLIIEMSFFEFVTNGMNGPIVHKIR